MANYQNHVVDPSYFFDAIEQFAFDYDAYIVINKDVDDYGRVISNFDKVTVRGSLQTQGVQVVRSKTGNTHDIIYNFYCKSLYRLKPNDVIFYKNQYLLVIDVHDYDEWGVRSCKLKAIQLTKYNDLHEYIKYINGEVII